jgi:pimeloyl-ACP methyl ester carboxylesterase
MQPVYEFGGQGTVIHFALANGFPPGIYAPLLNPLTANYRVLSLPPRALWPGERPPEALRDWQMLADDIRFGLKQLGLSRIVGIGHSFGGIASVLASLDDPDLFRALILLDPTILPTSAFDFMAEIQASGEVRHFAPVQSALRRKQTWENVDDAYQYFRSKPLFKDWSDEAVRLYAEEGTRPTRNGDGLELTWPAEWEAYYFSTMYTKIWDVIGRVTCPLLVIRGGDSDTFSADSLERVRGLLPDATYAEVPGQGHLFPLSAPDETRYLIQNWLAGLVG